VLTPGSPKTTSAGTGASARTSSSRDRLGPAVRNSSEASSLCATCARPWATERSARRHSSVSIPHAASAAEAATSSATDHSTGSASGAPRWLGTVGVPRTAILAGTTMPPSGRASRAARWAADGSTPASPTARTTARPSCWIVAVAGAIRRPASSAAAEATISEMTMSTSTALTTVSLSSPSSNPTTVVARVAAACGLVSANTVPASAHVNRNRGRVRAAAIALPPRQAATRAAATPRVSGSATTAGSMIRPTLMRNSGTNSAEPKNSVRCISGERFGTSWLSPRPAKKAPTGQATRSDAASGWSRAIASRRWSSRVSRTCRGTDPEKRSRSVATAGTKSSGSSASRASLSRAQ